jgi:UDP-N-acetylmuramate--alanine ligase
MNIESISKFFFIGIGGIGMSALARFFHAAGKTVAGYDKTATSLTGELMQEGISVQFEDDAEQVPEVFRDAQHKNSILIVYTPAIPAGSDLLNYFRKNGFQMVKRSQVLGIITRNACTIAVAGTHGKTTTSTMIAHVLKHSGIDCTAFLGGISKNYNSNLLTGNAKDEYGRPIVVVEADEYDRSFLQLHPHCAVITAMDADHLDIYKTYEAMKQAYLDFTAQVREGGRLIVRSDLTINHPKAEIWNYGLNQEADCHAVIHQSGINAYCYDIIYPAGKLEKVSLTMPGHHNVENSLAAVAVAKWMNVPDEKIKSALGSFEGIKRRFEFIIRHPSLYFIDDYAHHPDEISAVLKSVQQMLPDKKITGIFQPHLFSRTQDFANEFAASLSKLHRLWLLPIYPAREKPVPGVTSGLILEKLNIPATLESFESILLKVEKEPADVLITLGAGDIDRLVPPIKEILERKLKVIANEN